MSLSKAQDILFPPVEHADENGIVAFSREIDVDYLLAAYPQGIFPWPFDDEYIPWFCPDERAILDFSDFHLSKSMKRTMKTTKFELRINSDFPSVISACSAAVRKGQDGTWITEEMVRSYVLLHRLGHAVSFETWLDDELVGGLYGVLFNHSFAGESMFHTVTDASKFALVNMVHFFKSKGLKWIDVQQLTPLLASFGAKLIPRDNYLARLREAIDESPVLLNHSNDFFDFNKRSNN